MLFPSFIIHKMKKLKSLSIIIPFFNDEATVSRQLTYAYSVGANISNKFEIIAIHGGNSIDNTYSEIIKMKLIYPDLKILNKKNNQEGYAVIKSGFKESKNEWIFYTDGDAQYHIEEDLIKLIEKYFKTGADVINGYKIKRHDNLIRVLLGKVYAFLAKKMFNLPIRDVDCDFRLIRRKILNKIQLDSKDSSILPEMIYKLNRAGAKFAEVPVSHYPRIYGRSNYSTLELIKEKIIGDINLFLKLNKK